MKKLYTILASLAVITTLTSFTYLTNEVEKVPLQLQDPYVVDGFHFKLLDSNEAIIDKYVGEAPLIEIPDDFVLNNKSYNVVALGAYAFNSNPFIESITIPESIKYFSQKCISNLPFLSNLTFKQGKSYPIRYAETDAFYGTNRLIELSIPNMYFKDKAINFNNLKKIEILDSKYSDINLDAIGTVDLQVLSLPFAIDISVSNKTRFNELKTLSVKNFTTKGINVIGDNIDLQKIFNNLETISYDNPTNYEFINQIELSSPTSIVAKFKPFVNIIYLDETTMKYKSYTH